MSDLSVLLPGARLLVFFFHHAYVPNPENLPALQVLARMLSGLYLACQLANVSGIC